MTEMDALRLRLAARAYRATRPDEGEIERGVRRALSGMRRSQIRRRASLTPAIIVAILAFGTLAYANPNQVRRWMSALWLSTHDSVREQVVAQASAVRGSRASLTPAPAAAAAEAREADKPAAEELGSTPAPSAAPVAAPAAGEQATGRVVTSPARATARAQTTGRAQRANWAEVNSALAAGDTSRALAALADLSRHGDVATRAKAELGIAQLLWSRGDRATACSITNKLAQQKSTPGRVQERARTLGQTCKP